MEEMLQCNIAGLAEKNISYYAGMTKKTCSPVVMADPRSLPSARSGAIHGTPKSWLTPGRGS